MRFTDLTRLRQAMERPATATAPQLRRQFRTEVTKNSPKTSAKQTHPLPTLPTGSRIQGKIFLSYHLPFSRRYLGECNLNDDISRRSPTPDQDLEPPPLKIQLPSPGAASATSSDPPAQKQYEPTQSSTPSSESSTVKVIHTWCFFHN